MLVRESIASKYHSHLCILHRLGPLERYVTYFRAQHQNLFVDKYF